MKIRGILFKKGLVLAIIGLFICASFTSTVTLKFKEKYCRNFSNENIENINLEKKRKLKQKKKNPQNSFLVKSMNFLIRDQ